jgi:type II secretory pathway component PulK
MGEFNLNNRGGVLIFVLWTVMFLAVIALSLGQRTRAGLALINGHTRHIKAKALAWAGVMGTVERIRENGTGQHDTLYECGVDIADGQSPREMFRQTQLGDGSFDIAYAQDGMTFDGIEDEERRINLNALTAQDGKILFNLAELSGLSREQAEAFSGAVIGRAGGKFETLEELLLVPGISREMYAKVKSSLTVFPKSDFALKVNFNTAPRAVIGALARARMEEHLSMSDADRLTEKILVFRAGSDGQQGTADDKPVELSEMDLNVPERILAEAISPYQNRIASDYLRIRSRGIYQKAVCIFDVVVYRPHLSIVAWRMES